MYSFVSPMAWVPSISDGITSEDENKLVDVVENEEERSLGLEGVRSEDTQAQ